MFRDPAAAVGEAPTGTGGCTKEVCENMGSLCWNRVLAGLVDPWKDLTLEHSAAEEMHIFTL